MRILHVISQRPDSTGSGIYLQELLKAAAANGHENHLLAGVPKGQIPQLTMLPPERCAFVEFNSSSLPFDIVGMSDVMPYPSTRFTDLTSEDINLYEQAFTHTLRQVIADFEPDIIHSHHLWLLSSLIGRTFPDIPLIVSCHGTDIRQMHNCPDLRLRVRSGCDHIDHILALTPDQIKEISNLYRVATDKITFVGGGFQEKLFFQEDKPPPSPVRLLYAGKLSNAKGVPWLLKALAQLKDDDVHLDLIGSGSGAEFAECLHLAGQLDHRLTIHGQLPQPKLAELMRKAHIMVLPSLYEGLPLIMIEAVASGCRVIATDLPGTTYISDILDSDFLTLIKAPTEAELTGTSPRNQADFINIIGKALARSIEQSRLEPDLGLQPLHTKISFFSWQAVYRRTEEIYKILV